MRKKKNTLEQYKDIGAKFRLFKTMAVLLETEAFHFFYSKGMERVA